MIHLVNLIHAFLPVAAVAGLLAAMLPRADGPRSVRHGAWALAAGLFAGAVLFAAAVRQQGDVGVATSLHTLGLGSAALVLGLLSAALFPRAVWQGPLRAAALGLLFVLAALKTYRWLGWMSDQAMGATGVLTTELVVNAGAIALGVGMLAALGVLVALMGADLPRTAAALLVAALALLMIPWSAELMLGLLRLEWIESTSRRISYVSKVTAAADTLGTYLHLALPGLLLLGYLAFRPRPAPVGLVPAQRAAHRKFRLQRRRQLRWLVTGAGLQFGLGALLLLNDLYLSRPPRLSPATPVTPDSDGKVRIAVDAVRDGTLYRFAYLSAERHLVRFFLINRYRDSRVNIGVVFDACEFCGDAGYLQEGNDVVCLACNVHIFIPSIGKEGGCNPIPLEHDAGSRYIAISAKALERGARYFSEVIAG